MKGRIFLVVLLVIVAACAGRWVTRTMSPRSSNQEETRQSVRLESGARVEVRGINGSVAVEGVNGRVEVAQSFGHSEIKGVNGNVRVGVTQLGAQGMEIKGVNGNIEVRLKENIDADIDVKGNNGGLSLNVPNVTMQERENFSNMRARLGRGGAPIDIKGVNGQIRFESDAPAGTTTTSAAGVNTSNTSSGTSAALPPPPPPSR